MSPRGERAADAAKLAGRLARAEESLAHLSRLQESILDAAGEGICGTDTRGRITFVNPAAARMMGYQPEELIGKSAHETLHHSRPDGSPYPSEECPINRAFVEGTTYQARHEEDEVFWRKDGTSFPASFTYTPIRDDGRIVGGVLVFQDITERKEAQDRLLKSERELLEAQHVAHVGSWSWDVTKDEITWSDELFCIYGVDPQSFDPSYAAYTDRLLPEERPWITDLIARAIENRSSFKFDHRVTHPDGSVRWVEGRGRVLETPEGICLVGTALDITDRVNAQKQLLASEERYRSIFENAVEGIYRSSLDGRILAINPAAARLLGYDSPADAIASIHNLRHTYVDPVERDRLVQLLVEERSVSGFEVRLRRADGKVIWVELSVRVVGDPDDPAAFMEGMMLDVTSRKAAEDYLSQSEARTKAIVSSAPNGILTFDERGVLLDMNPAAERIFGCRSRDAAGNDISRILDLKTRSFSDTWLSEDAGTIGGEGQMEATALTSTGDRVPVEVAITPARLGSDRFFIAHVRDLTDQRRMEQARRDLELQVNHMQKMEALGHLAGGIAHDFNNLLAVIQNYAAFVREELGPNGPVTEDIDQVLHASRRASALTRQLVMFSRRDAANPEVVDLNQVVLDMEKLLRRVIGRDIRVATELRAPLWPIVMDVGQLEQVIMNLALNARDAMPDGGRLTLSTGHAVVDSETSRPKPGLHPGAYVVLTITDTGHGIPDHIGDRVFEPFFTSKEKEHGTGLGLATVFGIIKRVRGHISFDSDEGFGTSFHVYLPAETSHNPMQKDLGGAAPDTLRIVTDDSGDAGIGSHRRGTEDAS